VNTRPVRLAPLAAGARPTISSRGRAEPQLGTGLPQYGWSANERRLTTATSSRHATSLGQARHTLISASNSRMPAAEPASRETAAASPATGVAAVAGSPGHPVPGGTGDGKGRPVRG